MTNEKDREEARQMAMRILTGPHRMSVGLITEELLRYRAEAVKAERDNMSIIELPGPCDASCKHRWTSFEDMLEPCRSCKHITSTERWVTVNTNYEPLSPILSDDQEGAYDEAPEREETLQEYLDRLDGVAIDLEHGSN